MTATETRQTQERRRTTRPHDRGARKQAGGPMSSAEKFLRETYLPAVAEQLYPGDRLLMRMIEAELRERRAADEAWLASLTERERRAELIRRRIERCEQRLRAALDFRRYDDSW